MALIPGIPGPKGDAGNQGNQGNRGAKGAEGAQGKRGLPGLFTRTAWPQTLVYVVLLGIVIFGFWDTEQDAKDSCQRGNENREAIRDLATGIKELGLSFVVEPPEQQDPDTRAFVAYLESFEKRQFEKLPYRDC